MAKSLNSNLLRACAIVHWYHEGYDEHTRSPKSVRISLVSVTQLTLTFAQMFLSDRAYQHSLTSLLYFLQKYLHVFAHPTSLFYTGTP